MYAECLMGEGLYKEISSTTLFRLVRKVQKVSIHICGNEVVGLLSRSCYIILIRDEFTRYP